MQAGRRSRPVPVVGWRGAARPGRGRAGAGHHRRRRRIHRRRSTRRHRAVQHRRRCSTACPTTSAWSASGTTRTSSRRPASRRRPTRGTELLEQIQTLKDAGITPIAVGAGEQWPAHFWYSYLMVRLGGADGDEPDRRRQQLERACVIEAGEKVAELVALEPFQEGYLGAEWDAPDGESGTMASQGAAMDLMGQWALARSATRPASTTPDRRCRCDSAGPVPRGRRRRRRPRPTASAAPTGSSSARTRRRRRSSSSRSSSTSRTSADRASATAGLPANRERRATSVTDPNHAGRARRAHRGDRSSSSSSTSSSRLRSVVRSTSRRRCCSPARRRRTRRRRPSRPHRRRLTDHRHARVGRMHPASSHPSSIASP